jgi:hypothetical protein
MTRMSKQGERRAVSHRKRKKPSVKTGTRKDNLPKGFKEHANAFSTENNLIFIPKIANR